MIDDNSVSVAELKVEQRYLKEAVDDMKNTVKIMSESLLEMSKQLRNIENTLTSTLKRIDDHTDPDSHAKLVKDTIKSMSQDEVYELYVLLNSSEKVKEVKKKEFEAELKERRGDLSWWLLLKISALITLIIGTVTSVYIKMFLSGK